MTAGCRCPECAVDPPPPIDPRRLAELTREKSKPAPKSEALKNDDAKKGR